MDKVTKRIVVLGGGESGCGAAVLAKVKGFDVFLSDKGKIGDSYIGMLKEWDIPFEQGQHTEELVLNADEVIKSPGIPSTAPMVQKIMEKGIHVISEIEFAGRYDTAKKICITGSNGKTTTTSLIYYLLQQAGLNVGLGGNIGKSYAYQVATAKHDIYVLEISSFQLDNMYDFKADIAIITNITPDHLDRYDHKMENYVKAKFRITRNMDKDDCFIFCSDDEITINHLNRIVMKARMLPFSQKHEVEQGAFIRDERMVVRYNDSECDMYLQELALGGKHNIYNSMAAAIAGKVMDIDNEVIRKSLSSFQAVEHRLEKVLSIKDVLYINDSKATNVDAAWYALECQTRPVVWIVGGTDKGNDYAPLIPLAKEKVKAMICMGLDNKKFHESFKSIVPQIHDVTSAKDAVQLASRLASPGDVVLLSPCCASFDLFRNYEDRGRQFKEAVRNL
ncbi:MAG: UDP-N-acetylmuramoyl-L-alanine--D-glutamate ligase [Bacteroidetes bacterium]|uniref:UDP-N-acetylmuramoylalanine--D-glutamate ligase n=1 Tax=Candidatus Cryptobacteroides excrementipullorum TaxID=2840761 RepID=A0A9D9IT45_9BACT|nr:UDP-N-acetylmuramoyl-L-alanine--D-glutamate ligase [Candidatus Cryptobacteroides excrementipullorum]